ncbi:hypothetical protein COCOBI_10-3690 [Coccomyxa sp. Obi]|nr:hypothetical protein COCOBI_10-3690 [Coccomyxa sp. Obi]
MTTRCGRTRRQKKADVVSRPEVKLHKAPPQPNAGGSHLEFLSKTAQAAQEVPPQARWQVQGSEPQVVEAAELDDAQFLQDMEELDEWFKSQTAKLVCPCGTAE